MSKGYMEIIKSSIGAVYETGIASKILTYMDRIRNESDVGQARRWVMELLQNSRDCAYEDRDVRVRIELEKDKLRFSHNAKPFRVKDILSIINQVSSKSADQNTVGQFGTGFMSTYQLSSVVQLKSVLKEEGLPYKPFRICLDRSGSDHETILCGIEKTMEELQKADDGGAIEDFDPDAMNTEFVYHLDGDYYRKIASIGVEDLKETILYVLLFSRKISEVMLVFHGEGKKEYVRYKAGEERALQGDVSILEIGEERWEGEEAYADEELHRKTFRIASISNGELTLAAALDDTNCFYPLSEKLPRLFVDFPLIGAEEFPFPMVINSRAFRVNEPRSGITLVDNENSKDALENKRLILSAVELYRRFLMQADGNGFKSPENIIYIPEWKPNRELSEEWVIKHIYEGLFEIVSKAPVIECTEGYCALSDPQMGLPDPAFPEEKEALVKLLSGMKGVKVPSGEENWLWAFSNYPGHRGKRRTLRELAEKAEEIYGGGLDEEKTEKMEWLQLLYATAMKNEELKTAILAGQIKIFPGQAKEDSLHTVSEIYNDPGIPETLKEVSDVLDKLESMGALGIRKRLLHPGFPVEQGILREYSVLELSEHIVRRSDRGFKVRSYNVYWNTYLNLWHEAWKLLISCGPDRQIYDLYAKTVEEIPEYEKVECNGIAPSMWRACYYSFMRELASEIAGARTLQGVKARYAKLEEETDLYDWLNAFYEAVGRYLASMADIPYPDQEGTFRPLFSLKKDEMKYEELKVILTAFSDQNEGNRIAQRLLDRRIANTHTFLSSCTDQEVAQRIGAEVSAVLSKGSLSLAPDHHQEACSRLLAWIRQNSELANVLFPAFSNEEDQMKLLTPQAAVRLQRDADDLELLMQVLGETDPEKAMKKIQRLREKEEREEMGQAFDEGGIYYDPVSDVYFEGAMGMAGDDVLRRIGKGGEQYAYDELKNAFLNEGFVKAPDKEETKNLCCLVKGERKLTLELADRENYHQSGYDIRVEIEDPGKEPVILYKEVKTHTPGSVRAGEINLSDEQMILAANAGENYSVLHVVYDHKFWKGISMRELNNPVRLIGMKKLLNMRKGYQFREVVA